MMEDGEIIDDDVDDYTPLQRPADLLVPSTAHQSIADQLSDPEEEEEDAEDSDSDDSDSQTKAKKQKLKPKPPARSAQSTKYNIWSSGIQEEVLTEELTNCGVERRFERSRAVESYDYTLFDSPRDEAEPRQDVPFTNKRTMAERTKGPAKGRLGHRRRPSPPDEDATGAPREMPGLAVTTDSSDEEVARDIATKLSEEKDELIARVVEVLGKQRAIELYELTTSIEADGGMLVMNRTRRRTPGGVYLFHVKGSCSQEDSQRIFIEDRRQIDALKRQERAKKRREKAKELHRRLEEGNLLHVVSRPKVRAEPLSGEEEETGGVSNPPPSPVTDGRADSSPEPNPTTSTSPVPATLAAQQPPGRTLTTYDDFLDLNTGEDNMDIF